MRLALLPLFASLTLVGGCAGVLLVPPTVGLLGGMAIGSGPSKKADSTTTYGLIGAALGVAVDIALIVVITRSSGGELGSVGD